MNNNNRIEIMNEKFEKCKNIFSELYNLMSNNSVYEILNRDYSTDLDMLEVSIDDLEIHFNNLHYIIENILNSIPDEKLSTSSSENTPINSPSPTLTDTLISSINSIRSSPQIESEEENKMNEIIENMMTMVSEIRKKKLQDNVSQDKLLAFIMYSFMLQDENSILNKPNEEIIPESYLDLDNIAKPFDINDVD